MSRLRVLALPVPLCAALAWPQPSHGQPSSDQGPSSGISCVIRDGVPTTVSQTRRGEVPIILWTSRVFDASGWTPEKRCQAVSQRFEAFRSSGQLKVLTTGRVAGLPVICALPSERTSCLAPNVLYTLKPKENATDALVSLLAVRRGASGAIKETPSRLYVDFNRMLEEKLLAQPGGKP